MSVPVASKVRVSVSQSWLSLTSSNTIRSRVPSSRNVSVITSPSASVTMRSAQITGILAPLIGISVVMQQILSLLGAQEAIGQWVSGLGGYWVMLAASMAIIFVAGMVLESLPVTIILAPILAPLAAANGMDPVHFAVIFLVGASIGFVTPPYGLNLYVASSVTGVPYMRLLRYALYYLAALLSVWIIVAVTPSLATILLPSR